MTILNKSLITATTILIMACGAILGGIVGGKFASNVKPSLLKWIVVCTGFTVAIIFSKQETFLIINYKLFHL